jgi:hypothetical protein
MCPWSNAAHLMMAGSAKRIASADDRYALENHFVAWERLGQVDKIKDDGEDKLPWRRETFNLVRAFQEHVPRS